MITVGGGNENDGVAQAQGGKIEAFAAIRSAGENKGFVGKSQRQGGGPYSPVGHQDRVGKVCGQFYYY